LTLPRAILVGEIPLVTDCLDWAPLYETAARCSNSSHTEYLYLNLLVLVFVAHYHWAANLFHVPLVPPAAACTTIPITN
jgi:hypothetical protein